MRNYYVRGSRLVAASTRCARGASRRSTRRSARSGLVVVDCRTPNGRGLRLASATAASTATASTQGDPALVAALLSIEGCRTKWPVDAGHRCVVDEDLVGNGCA